MAGGRQSQARENLLVFPEISLATYIVDASSFPSNSETTRYCYFRLSCPHDLTLTTYFTSHHQQQPPDSRSNSQSGYPSSMPASTSSQVFDSPGRSERQYEGNGGYMEEDVYHGLGPSSSRKGSNNLLHDHGPPSSSRPQRSRQKTTSSIASSSRIESHGDAGASKPTQKRERPVGVSHKKAVVMDKECSFCLGTDRRNREGRSEPMLGCRLCG